MQYLSLSRTWSEGDHLLPPHLHVHPNLHVSNYWDMLKDLLEEALRLPVAMLEGHAGEALDRTVNEMWRFYKQVRKQTIRDMPDISHPAATDNVAYFKYAHLYSPINCSVPVPNIKFDIRSRYAFWQRIALSQMRHQG